MEFNKLKNKDKSLVMRNRYKRWKYNALDNSAYFIIFQGFLEADLLKDISGNALKLYIYLGLNSNNYEGVVWHSNKKIAEYFDRSERTIRVWMKELENLNLIKRMRLEYDGIVYTYLQPYTYKYEIKDNNGILYFNTSGFLVYQQQNVISIYREFINISIFIDDIGWISGVLKVKDFDEKFLELLIDGFIDIENEYFNITYEFESFDKKIKLNLSEHKDILLKAKLI